MVNLVEVNSSGTYWKAASDYTCPHCRRQQVVSTVHADLSGVQLNVRQCLSCRGVSIDGAFRHLQTSPTVEIVDTPVKLYPASQVRPHKHFEFSPTDVSQSYEEACLLVSVHVGAAGAYARRALELILDKLGYAKPSLAQSIELVESEKDADKRLPKRLRSRLNYIKEIGNFALHIRRDGELAIVSIDADEVEACLETIEDLINYIYEEPGNDRRRAEALNTKLAAAGKKTLPLPDDNT